MLKAVIIDDVMQARAALRADLKDHCPQVEIVGEAEGVETGIALIRKESPDLIFLDIKMNDGTGFDLLEKIGKGGFKVIFTTAFNDQAIRAFRFSAIDYLLKPVDPQDLKRAVEKYEDEKQTHQDQYRFLLENFRQFSTAPVKKIALNTHEKVHFVSVNEILRCESDSNYTSFFLQDGSKILVTKTMKDYEDLLEPHGFIRVHHSHFVNINHVREFVKNEGGMLVMKDGSLVPVSSRKKDVVLKRLQEM